MNSISLDVGGTTTDIAFWENGLPLMAKRGANINGYPTAVRAFHMRSIGIGGDSRITKLADGNYQFGPEREGLQWQSRSVAAVRCFDCCRLR